VANNLIFGTTRPTLVENTNKAVMLGWNNWLATGVNPGPLTNSTFSASPGFQDAAGKDFTLAASSAAIGGASQLLPGLPIPAFPIKEYYRDETVAREFRIRASSRDIGAFESTTTGTGVGPYDTPPRPKLSATVSNNATIVSWPLTAADYVLDQAGGLAPPVVWTSAPAPYLTNSSDFRVNVPLPAGNRFYRLRRP
jgi:hypothetical protein